MRNLIVICSPKSKNPYGCGWLRSPGVVVDVHTWTLALGQALRPLAKKKWADRVARGGGVLPQFTNIDLVNIGIHKTLIIEKSLAI